MKRIIGLLVLGLVLFVPAFAQIDLQPVAIVNLIRSEPITVAQLRTEVENMEKQEGRALTLAERRQVLEAAINERLVIQAAERDRLTVTDNDINLQLQELQYQVAQSIGRQPTDAEFRQIILNETGMDYDAYQQELGKQLTLQKYIMAKKGDQLNNISNPTEAEILNTYNLYRTNFVRPDTIRYSTILVPFTDSASRTRARTIADRLGSQIGNNAERFDEAVQRGQSGNADYQAGDAGYFYRMPEYAQAAGQEFMDAAFSLRQGQVSRVLETPGDFRIIKITESYAQKNLELNDIAQFETGLTVRQQIINTLRQQTYQEVLTRVIQELFTELRRGNPYQIYENNLNW